MKPKIRYLTLSLLFGLLLVTVASHIALAQPTASLPVIDDFESALPGTWFQYGDYGSGTAITTTVVATNTVPGLDPNNVLTIDYTSAGWGAGTGNNLAGQDWSQYDGFGFWFRGAATGATFRVILSDNPNPAVTGDSAERFAYEFTDDSNAWRHILIPWGAFFRDYAYQPPNAPNDGLTLTEVQAYALALPSGTSAVISLDDVRLVKFQQVDDFESALPGTWFQYGDYGSGTAITTTVVATNTVPGLDPNNVLAIDYTSAGWGAGTGNNLGGQDWSSFKGMSFWFWGGNSGQTYRVILSDNPNPAVTGDSAERFAYEFTDNFSGWRFISIPWDAFFRDYAYQPPNAPNDGLTLTEVQAYALALPGGSRTTYLDNVSLFGDGNIATTVGFAQRTYSVTEGDQASLTVTLSAAATQTVTVDFAYTGGTAIAGTDYQTQTQTTLTFSPGVTEQAIPVVTVDDTDQESDETVLITLSNPTGATLGARTEATLTIADNDQPVLSGKSVLIDDFELTSLPLGKDSNNNSVGYVTWNHPAASSAITLTTTPPAPVPLASNPNTVLQVDLTIGSGQWAGYTHAFTNSAADTWVSQDWSSYVGVSFWLYGRNSGGTLYFDIAENRNPGSTTDDAERWSVDIPDNFDGWKFFTIPFSDFKRKEIGNGAPNDGLTLTEVWGYAIGGFGSIDMGTNTYFVDDVSVYGNAGGGAQALKIEFAQPEYTVTEGESVAVTVTLSAAYTDTVSVAYRSAESLAVPDRDYTPVTGTLTFAPGETAATFTVQTFGNSKHTGDRPLMLNLSNAVNAELGFAHRAMVTIQDDDAVDPLLVDDFEGWHPFATAGNVTLSPQELMSTDANARPDQDPYEFVLDGTYDTTGGSASFARTFAEPRDWSPFQGLFFWYYGSGSGKTVTVELRDNQAKTTADVPAADWTLVWSDEFNDPAGTKPNPNVWTPEIGDGTMNGIPGWGNGEFQFYTNDASNASTDGAGNLVISVQETAPGDNRQCWYGPCQYTSARLISRNKADFKYGRIEARAKVPSGDAGLWPAFWMLGDNIGEVGWPQSGEIDIMEYVSRIPNEVFGTIHGPGYSGGNGFGNTYTIAGGVANDYHTFAIEWGPDEIHWYVDGVNYHNATPADVAPNEWVYNHPFYLILNMAIGGNFGGAIADSLTFPQDLLVDYVRVYQATDTAERFEASFVDDFVGWKKVELPFAFFQRSTDQPAGAPNDGLGLSAVTGYGFRLPDNSTGSFKLDMVHLYHIYYFPFIAK